MYIVFILTGLFIALCAGILIYCYVYAFRGDSKRQSTPYDVPTSGFKDKVIKNIMCLMNTPYEDVEIMSDDSLRLYGRYYHFKDGAPVAIMMHGYRSNSYRDCNGAFQLALKYGLNVLMPDQRAHGKSQGKTISFGVKERRDCALWVDYLTNRLGKDIKIILVGLSMGAATVMMASDLVPPENVKGIIADCGFSSPADILKEVAAQMHYPVKPTYFFLRLGARIFGGFDPEEHSAVKSLRHTSIPVLFIHGENDDFVPCRMSRECHDACASKKQIFTVKNAAHGTSYYLNTEGYGKTVSDFLDYVLNI